MALYRACSRCGVAVELGQVCSCKRDALRRASNTPERKEARAFYMRARWRNFRRAVMNRRFLCEDCKANGRPEPAVELHHIIDPRERPDLAYKDSNVIPLCKSCHSRRTAQSTLGRARRG